MSKPTPYQWQSDDLNTLEANNWVGLLNMQVGSGKTLLSTWAVERSGAKVVLIIAPESTFETAWQPTVKQILDIDARVLGRTGKARKEALFDFEMGFDGVYLCTPQFLTRTDISEWSGDFVIADEVHELSSPKSKGQRKLSGFTPADAADSIAARFPHRLALSGTAWRNNFERAWSVVRFINPELRERGEAGYFNYFGWLAERMQHETIYTSRKDRNGNPVKAKKWLTETVPGKLISELPCVITHKRRERCCDAHPNGFLKVEEPNVKTHVVPLHPKQRKAFQELEEQYLTWLGEHPLIVELPITMQIRLRQLTLGVPTITFETETKVDENGDEFEVVKELVSFDDDCESPFTDFLVDQLRELDGEPVVVFLDSQQVAAVLVKRLNKAGFSAFEFSGATRKTRSADLAEFGAGLKFNVMVATIASVGTGTDGMQHRASTEFWLSESTDRTLNQQGKGRLDRIGSQKQVSRNYLVDDLGYAVGKMSERLEKELELAKTLRVM